MQHTQKEIAQKLLEQKKAQETADLKPHDPSLTFIDEKELSQILGVALGTLRRQRWSGDGIRYYKFNGACRYRMADVLAYIDASARTSTSDTGATA